MLCSGGLYIQLALGGLLGSEGKEGLEGLGELKCLGILEGLVRLECSVEFIGLKSFGRFGCLVCLGGLMVQ